MNKILYLLLFIICTKTVCAQNISGIVQSAADGLGIEGTHIVNITKNDLAISSELGFFYIKGEIGDTLLLSNINYLKKQFIIKTEDHLKIVLTPNMIQLDEVIVSNLPTTEAGFRKKLIDMPMQDNGKMVPFGVTPGKLMPTIPVIYDKRVINGLGYAISNPLKYTASKLNGKFQEKVKYWAIQADLDNSLIRDKKYNRTLVASLTKLESDELTNFIHFMDLADSFINSASEYEIAERIREEFKEYQLQNKEN